MKAVLMSIQPKWCELIAEGKKTVEVRKTKPKLEVPFKVYIYCTNGDALAYPCLNNPKFTIHRTNNGTLKGRQMIAKEREKSDHLYANGKVIGEFVCDFVDEYKYAYCPHPEIGMDYDCGDNWWEIADEDLEQACLTYEEFKKYVWGYKEVFGWHISNLVIYDKPRELIQFHKVGYQETRDNVYGWTVDEEMSWCIRRPPQSWCYVEEVE